MSTVQISEAYQQQLKLNLLKSGLMRLLADTDDISILEKLHAVYQQPRKSKLPKDEIVGSAPDGKPITRYEMEQELLVALKQVQEGDVISLEELEKESENW